MQLSELQLLADMCDLCISPRAQALLTVLTITVCKAHIMTRDGGRVLTFLSGKRPARRKGRHAGTIELQACLLQCMLTSCSTCAVTLHRLAKLHICASRAGYAEPYMSVGRSPMPPPQAYQAQPGAVWTAIILICATLTALAGAFTAFIMYMRPVLKVCCIVHLHCIKLAYRELARLPWAALHTAKWSQMYWSHMLVDCCQGLLGPIWQMQPYRRAFAHMECEWQACQRLGCYALLCS